MSVEAKIRSALRAKIYNFGPGSWYLPAYRNIARSLEISQGAVLEIGCGPGWVSIFAAEGHPELDCVGIDTNPAMVTLARRNAGAALNCSFREMDGAQVVFPEATFERVVAVQTMHHWTDPDRVVGEIHRVLKPSGFALLFDANPAAELPKGWIQRRGPFPPDFWVRRMWARHSLGDAGYEDMLQRVMGAGFAQVQSESFGFYRVIRALR